MNINKYIIYGSKNKKHLHTDSSLVGVGQYNSIGEYCGPHTASSVFLILVWVLVSIITYRGVLWPSYCLLCVSYISMGLGQYNNL